MMTAVHRFEAAGLGKAPFRVVGVEERRGPLPILDKDGNATGATVGAPGQPMGTCDYCGTGIAECWHIKSADGRRFIVGCDCVFKVDDAGLKRTVTEHKSKARHGREAERIAAAKDAFPSVAERMGLEPHPYPHMAEKGHTLASWAEWMFAMAGHSGQLRAARAVERFTKDKETGPTGPERMHP